MHHFQGLDSRQRKLSNGKGQGIHSVTIESKAMKIKCPGFHTLTASRFSRFIEGFEKTELSVNNR